MKNIAIKLLSIALLLCSNFTVFSGELEENIQKMAKELELKFPGRTKVKVALLQFRTSDNQLTKFNQYINDEITSIYKDSKRFELIDPNSVSRMVESFGWSLEKS